MRIIRAARHVVWINTVAIAHIFERLEDFEKVHITLVGERLAACVNIVPAIRSVYRWEGQVQDDIEALLVIKTRAACYERLEQTIAAAHPYELPEIIAVPVERGFAPYLAWINDETH